MSYHKVIVKLILPKYLKVLNIALFFVKVNTGTEQKVEISMVKLFFGVFQSCLFF